MSALASGDPRVEGDMTSKPYKHGSMWRCRRKTEQGWRWCPSGKTPEEAVALAQRPAQEDAPVRGDLSQEDAPVRGDHPVHDPVHDPVHEQEQPLAGGVRVEGPYQHRGRWRCRLASASGRSWCPAGKSPAHALKIAEAQAEEEARQGVRLVRECIEQYLADLERRGIRARSIATFRGMICRYFGPVLDDPLARVTPHRAAALYEQLRQSLGERTGKPLAVDTHKNALSASKSFLGWCVARHWLKSNPAEHVRAVGNKKKGKAGLTIDESRQLYRVALQEAEKDDGALITCMGIAMGLRAGEVVSRVVRDIDDGGRTLRVCDHLEYGWRTKSDSSKRPVGIPTDLQPLLRGRAAGKDPMDLLFPSAVGRLQWSSWCNRQVARVCKLAGVPRVCMHSLRGIAGTLAASAGTAPEVVARMLGHESAAQTIGAYVPAHVIDQAERDKGMRALLIEPTAPA